MSKTEWGEIKMTYYMVAGLPYSAELYHHGIKGQKWGIRRFQQENGTLTSAGRERYADAIAKSATNVSSDTKNNGSSTNSSQRKEKLKKIAKAAAVTAGTAALAYGTYKLAKSGTLSDIANAVSGKTNSLISDVKGGSDGIRTSYRSLKAGKRATTASRLKDAAFSFKMSDEELLSKINRLENEAKLTNLTYDSIMNPSDPKKRIILNAGKKTAETVLAGVGIYGIKALLTKKISPKEAADYLAPKPKKK